MSEYAMLGRYGDEIDWNLNFADKNVQTEYTMFKAASIPNYCLTGLGVVITAIFLAYWGTEVLYSKHIPLSFDLFKLSFLLVVVPFWLIVWFRNQMFMDKNVELIRTTLIYLESWAILVTTACMSMVVFSRTEQLLAPFPNHPEFFSMTMGSASIFLSSLSVAVLLFLPMLASIFFSFARWNAMVIANTVSYTTIVGCVIFVSSVGTAFCLFAVMLILSVIQYFYRLQQMRLFICISKYFEGKRVRERERADAAERLSNETRNLVSNLCHDMKTPLAALSAALASMKSLHDNFLNLIDSTYYVLPDFVRKMVCSLQEAVVGLAATYHMLLATVNRSTDFTKTFHGIQLVPTLEIINLWTVVEDLKDFITGLNDHQSLIVEPPPHNIAMQVVTDRQWLLDNMMALASNGVKYSSLNNVNLRIYLSNDGEVKYSGEEFLRFDFTNTGSLIPLEKSQLLFDAPDFSQQRSVGGAGLSLFCLSKRIQAMRGKYGAEPLPNRNGMLFWFTVPCTRIERAETLGSPELRAALAELNGNAPVVLGETENDEDRQKEEKKDGGNEKLTSSFDTSAIPEESSGRERKYKTQEQHTSTSFEGTVRVLIVDDSPLLLKMLRREMKIAGKYEVNTCTTGTEALLKVFPTKKQSRSLSHSSDTMEETGMEGIQRVGTLDELLNEVSELAMTYDLILMDLQMPVMDGYTAIRKIRTTEKEHAIYGAGKAVVGAGTSIWAGAAFRHLIVAMSANSDCQTVEDAYNAGADYFVPKPFKVDTLQQTVTRYMESKKK